MGTRGPKPLPSALKQARGTFRPDRAATNEPNPIGRPSCPSWLSKDAKREFRRLVKLLGDMGLLGAVDTNALARYATTWVRWRQAIQAIEKTGEVTIYRDDAGNVKAVQQAAYVSIARGLAEQLDRLEQSFGMNPSARSRIEVSMPKPAAPEQQAKSRFFNDPN